MSAAVAVVVVSTMTDAVAAEVAEVVAFALTVRRLQQMLSLLQ